MSYIYNCQAVPDCLTSSVSSRFENELARQVLKHPRADVKTPPQRSIVHMHLDNISGRPAAIVTALALGAGGTSLLFGDVIFGDVIFSKKHFQTVTKA
jgi:hypothetical protein